MEIAARRRPLAAFGLLFSHYVHLLPMIDNGEWSCFLKHRGPFGPAFSPSPFHATIEDWKRC
jgi:hypothetical protein